MSSSDSAGVQACLLVYVSASERVANVARAVQGRPVLVVAESEDAARDGGIISFVMLVRKLKLEINNDAARQVRISIPSDILEMARIVK